MSKRLILAVAAMAALCACSTPNDPVVSTRGTFDPTAIGAVGF